MCDLLLIPPPKLSVEIINSALAFLPQGDQLCAGRFQSSEQELTNSKHLLGNSGQVMASLQASVFLFMKTKIILTSSSCCLELKKIVYT